MFRLLKCTATLEVFLELIPNGAKNIRFTCHRDFAHQNHPGWPLGLFHKEIQRNLLAALDDPLRRVAIDESHTSSLGTRRHALDARRANASRRLHPRLMGPPRLPEEQEPHHLRGGG